MSIVSELIRESLIHHFSHYILSTLIHNYNNNNNNNQQKTKESEKELKVLFFFVN
jgi:transposase